jgi:hypothetical protein
MLNKEDGRREKGDGRWKMEDRSDWFQQRSGRFPLIPLFLRGESLPWSPPFGKGRLGGIF